MSKNNLKLELNIAKQNGFYEISEAAKLSGVNAKMIRYYESKDLLPKAKRTLSNYRIYSAQDIQMLILIKRARSLGFPLEQIKHLLKLWDNQYRASKDVKQLVLGHIAELEDKIKQMQAMCQTLHHLADCCHGDKDPQCFILDSLAELAPTQS